MNDYNNDFDQARASIDAKSKEMATVNELEKTHRGNNLDQQLIMSRKDMEMLYRSNHMDQTAYDKMTDDFQLMYILAIEKIAE